jgi:hypothetical protein
MDRTIDELIAEVKSLKELVSRQSEILNNIIIMIHVSDTDLKNHLDILDQ